MDLHKSFKILDRCDVRMILYNPMRLKTKYVCGILFSIILRKGYASMKRFLVVLIMLTILLAGLAVPASAAAGWNKQENGTWTYTKADGTLAQNEWIRDGGNWYYFNGTEMLENIKWKINGVWYAFNGNGVMASSGWTQCRSYYSLPDLQWFYANADGSLVTGWKKISGKWYYFWPAMAWDSVIWFNKAGVQDWGAEDPDIYAFDVNGAMITNAWFRDFTKSWYYLGNDGRAVKGWIRDGGKWYYLDSKTGLMYCGSMYRMSNGKVYGFSTNGDMVTGWYQYDGDWYYFRDSGSRMENEWVLDGGKWYYLKNDGRMARNEKLTIKGKDYSFGEHGEWLGN